MNPNSSPFDLRWRMLGINFQIHSSYWLMSLLFGYLNLNGSPAFNRNPLLCMALWCGAVLVSLIAHELGHVLTGMVFGQPGNLTIYSMGGPGAEQYAILSTWKRILVIAAGPAAGFGLWALTAFVIYPYVAVQAVVWSPDLSRWVLFTLGILVMINLIWSIFNLFPVLPLDGGQLMKDFCMLITPTYGMRIGYSLSFAIALFVTVYSGLKLYYRSLYYPPLDPFFNLVFFAMFAYQNFNALRTLPWGQRHRQFEEEPW